MMACPAVRLSVEIRTTKPPAGAYLADEIGYRCSDEEECEFVKSASCLLTMLQNERPARAE